LKVGNRGSVEKVGRRTFVYGDLRIDKKNNGIKREMIEGQRKGKGGKRSPSVRRVIKSVGEIVETGIGKAGSEENKGWINH